MVFINRFLFVFIFCLVTFNVSSQKALDFFNLNYTTLPNANFKNKQGKVSLNTYDFNLITPTLKLKSKTKINNTIYYRFSKYDFDIMPLSNIQLPSELHEIKYMALFRYTFNKNYEALFVPRCNIRSDFKSKFSTKDIFPSVAAIFMKISQKNENFKWGLGLNYNNDLGKNSFMPIIAFKFSDEKMRFNAFFPNNATLVLMPNERLEYGIAFTTDPTLSHINTVDGIQYLRTLNVNLNPTFSYNISSNVWLNLKAGVVLKRKYDLYNSDFETPSDDYENKLKPSAYIQVGFSLRSKE